MQQREQKHSIIIHTPVVCLPQQKTLQPSTEPQMATAPPSTAKTAIIAFISPSYRHTYE